MNYTLSINNADLKEKINEIEELNEIRIKAFSDISKLKTEIRKQKNSLFSFTSNLSHQLKKPLSAVIMGTDYLKIKGKQSSNDVLQKQINIIHLSSQRILDIINKIKVLNTLERNNFSEKKELIRITDFLKFIEEFSSNNPLCYELGVELDLEIKSSFNTENAMFGDKELLTEMFDNIISNSIKYSGNTGKSKIIIKADKFQDNNVKFIIEDFGIGIKDNNETAVTERHFRENSNIEGDGLGLNIVQSIVDYHKGIMKIINKGADKGIIIEITMPILYEKKLKY